jgi:hypothetical protein
MTNYGIKVLKPNAPSQYSVLDAPIRYLTILSTVESHKMAFEGSLNTTTTSVTHSLGYIPFYTAFYEESNGDLYPMGYIDDQFFDSMYTYGTTSVLHIEKYNKAKYYAIFFE